MNRYLAALTIKNLFSILVKDQPKLLFQRSSVLNAMKYFAVSRDDFALIFTQWKSEQFNVYPGKSNDENRLILAYVIACLLCENIIHDEFLKALHSINEIIESGNIYAKRVLAQPSKYRAISDIKRRAAVIVEEFNGESPELSIKPKKDFYIANQISPEGFDELQRLVLAAHLGCNCALDGSPGTGKTRAIIEVASILGKNLFTRTCSSRTSESHIISFPVLTVEDGASVTAHVNGPLAQAMEEGGIFYGDEFNLLKDDVQKRLNSAFDERCLIDRNDGVVIRSKKGFWAAISYNASENLTSRDLEDSVADRFIHLHFMRWAPDFKAFISRQKASSSPVVDKDNTIALGWRGIDSNPLRFYRGKESPSGVVWFDFCSGEKLDKKPDHVYRVYDTSSILGKIDPESYKELSALEKNAYNSRDLSRILSRFTDMLHALATTGSSKLLKTIGFTNLVEKENVDILSLHESSARIEIAALQHYNYLKSAGLNTFLAQTYAVNLVIDQVCYGQYRNKRLKDMTVYELVVSLAKGMRLFSDNSKFNTTIDLENILKFQGESQG